MTTNNSLYIARNGRDESYIDGQLSNVRIVKGTAVYTSSFKPPTEPLTNITNTTLLCCNDSSTTGKTVGPTITANNSPTASTDSPFYDSSCAVFGPNEDQDVIKCGSYVGNNSNDGPHIPLGFEPQFLMVKCSTANENWEMYDNMRGVVDNSVNNDDAYLKPNANSSETLNNRLRFTATGFQPTTASGVINDPQTYIYIAIRRPDGYVGKPPELGTSVFNMGLGQNSTTIPNYISGFPVDMGIHRLPASTSFPVFVTRLMGPKYLRTDTADAEASGSWATFDSNTGYITNQQDNTHQAWMWKRHAGFDVCTWTGDGVQGRQIPHSLSKSPEMIWVKTRSQSSQNWMVGHKGLNGGTNPWEKYINLNTDGSENDYPVWNDQAPTSTHFAVSSIAQTNASSETYVAMLFASVDGISKVGYYAGSGSTQTITTGFQPRFLIVKVIDNQLPWYVLDTTRGWAAGNDSYLQLNDNAAQVTNFDFGAPTATGFTMQGGAAANNESGLNYIYYAHA